MKHYTLLYKIRAIIKVLIFVQLIIILIYGVLNCFFVIRFFSIAYLFMILIISISAYRLLKHYIDNATPSFNARSIFKLIFIPVLIMLIILYILCHQAKAPEPVLLKKFSKKVFRIRKHRAELL